MTLFGEGGRRDVWAVLSLCPHGKDEESCPRCALAQTARDNAAPIKAPYPAGSVDEVTKLTPEQRRCAEFDAREDEIARHGLPVLVGGGK